MFTLKKNSLNVKFDDIHHWMAVCGYTLPQTEGDMARFDKLYADYQPNYSIEDLDFESIWNDEDQFQPKQHATVISIGFKQMKMAARGLNSLSHEIKEKMDANQLKNGK